MELKKYRWSRSYESAEEELENILAAKRIVAERWVATENEIFDRHLHKQDKRLWCVEGSIIVTTDSKAITLQAGDALDLPAQTEYAAKAGFSGCVCYESPEPKLNPAVPIR